MEVPGAEITRTPAWAAIATVSSREPPSTRTASKSASWAARLDNAVRRWVAAFSAGMTTATSGAFGGIGRSGQSAGDIQWIARPGSRFQRRGIGDVSAVPEMIPNLQHDIPDGRSGEYGHDREEGKI